jgi:hypothetical protein
VINRLLGPAALYFVVFFALNPHLATAFSTHYFFGGFDGFQNIWNLWWVDIAIRERGMLPWSTDFLHYPYGTTLIGHTLNPFNGLLAIPLLTFLTLLQTYNTIVVFSFVMAGLTAFWLCLHVTGSYRGSLLGGAVFTFSSFHFMHADGHLQWVALEWLPLFLLCWIRYCDMPSRGRGVAAAIVLFMVALCDLYQFAFSVFAGALFYLYQARRRRDWWFLFRRERLAALAGFLVPAALTSGVLAAALIAQQARETMFGTHSPIELSMDLLSPFLWGYYWRFRDAVPWLWKPLSPHVTQASVHIGLTIIGLAIYGWRRAPRLEHRGFWMAMLIFFGVMSLGPNLHIGGHDISLGLRGSFMGRDNVNMLALPYAWLWVAFPPWRLAGVPLLMMVMVQLVFAIGAAAGWEALRRSQARWAAALVLAIATIEYLPYPLRLTDPRVPKYVEALRDLPEGAVLDLASGAAHALYYQTVHGKPIAFGYISRTPASVDQSDLAVAALVREGQWEELVRRYHFTYIVKGDRSADVMMRGINEIPLAPIDASRALHSSDGVTIYGFSGAGS